MKAYLQIGKNIFPLDVVEFDFGNEFYEIPINKVDLNNTIIDRQILAEVKEIQIDGGCIVAV